jgi:hypothetical protein
MGSAFDDDPSSPVAAGRTTWVASDALSGQVVVRGSAFSPELNGWLIETSFHLRTVVRRVIVAPSAAM